MYLSQLRPMTMQWAQSRPEPTFQPPVHVLETTSAFELRLELPGVDPSGLDLTFENDELTVKGAKSGYDANEGVTLHRDEVLVGEFERTFSFSTPVVADSIQAESRHGVLHVTVQKAAEAVAKKIPIHVIG